MDVFNEIYMDLPQEFKSQGDRQVSRLLKSFNGLKQAPRQWNVKLCEALVKCNFKQSQYDQSLFSKRTDSKMVIVLVYVDDILVTGNNLNQIIETKAALHKMFKIKYLGELKYFLGIEFARSKEGTMMHQRKYAGSYI